MTIIGEPYTQRQLGDYLGFARRRWYIIVLALLVGVALAVALLAVLPKTYESKASVLVRPTIATGTSVARGVTEANLDTEAQVVKSVPVSTEVKKRLSSPLSPSQLASHVSITVPPNTTIMGITYSSGTASGAQAGAQAYAESYLDYQTQQAQDQVDAQLKVLDDKIAATDQDISALNKKIAAQTLGPAASDDAKQSLRTLQRRSAALSARRLPLETAPTDAGSVIDSASKPGSAARPNPTLVAGSSVALLLLCGLLLAWALDRRTDRIRQEAEVEAEAQIEVLGTLHSTRLGDDASKRHRGRSLQQYRQLVNAIQARLGASGGALLVAGVGGTPLAQEVAHSLGVAMARTGSSVLLIGSDREPTWATSSARSGADPRTEPATTSLATDDLVVDGNVLTTELRSYLEGLRDKWRQVLLLTPPMARSADAQAIAPFVQLTVVVLELNRTTHRELAEAMRQLRQVHSSPVVAIALKAVSARARRQAASPARAAEKAERRGSHDATKSTESIQDERVTGSKQRG